MSASTDSVATGTTPGVEGTRRVFRMPLAPRLLSLFALVVVGGATACLMVFAVLFFPMQRAVGLFMMASAGLMAALTAYCWRDFAGKWRLRVILGPDAVTLDLPAGRSLIHRPPAQHLTVPYSDIAAIDARFEAYGSFGMKQMQRAYVLRRKSGELIFLFEERALGTGMETAYFTDIVADLAAQAGVGLHDLGTVEGKGGILAAWGARAPDWAAPALPRERAVRLWRQAANTGALAIAVLLIALLVRLLVGG